MIIALLVALGVGQSVQLQPPSADTLKESLESLRNALEEPTWCTKDCFTLYACEVRADLNGGNIEVSLSGRVHGKQPAYVPLFRSDSVTDILEGTNKTTSSRTLWSGEYYSIASPPGDFAYQAVLRVPKQQALTLTLAGPIGKMTARVRGGSLVGPTTRRNVKREALQLVPEREGEALTRNVVARRLEVLRTFEIGRDREFRVRIEGKGLKPGEVIKLDLLPGEKVESINGQATERQVDGVRQLHWVVDDPNAALTYGGKWQAESLSLAGPSGSTRETWDLRCNDPFVCAVTTEVEVHQDQKYHPLPGQTLEATWRALTSGTGIHTVAQSLTVVSTPVGRDLHQTLRSRWTANTSDLLSITLPKGALVTELQLDGEDATVLRDENDSVRVKLPAGDSNLLLMWEVPNRASLLMHPPMPTFSQPVANVMISHWPAQGYAWVAAGGLPGTPAIDLWPQLLACIAIAFALTWFARKKGFPVLHAPQWYVVAAGFGLTGAYDFMPLVLVLGWSRFMRANRSDGKWTRRIVIALGLVATLSAVGTTLEVVNQALFDDSPIQVRSFTSPQGDADSGGQGIAWSAYVAGNPNSGSNLPSAWGLRIPLLWIRLTWVAWAVVLGMFVAKESAWALQSLRTYVRKQPAPSKQPRPNGPTNA